MRCHTAKVRDRDLIGTRIRAPSHCVVENNIGLNERTTNLEKLKHHIELLRDKVDAMNVTDNQSSVMRFPSIGGCLLIKELGGEATVMFHPMAGGAEPELAWESLKLIEDKVIPALNAKGIATGGNDE